MKRIIDFFFADIWRKLLALALTCLLYWNLSDREQVTKQLTVPVDVEVASGLFMPEDYKLEVRVTARGTERSLKEAKIRGMVKVGLRDQNNGKFRVRLDERIFERRKDIVITAIEPEFIDLPVQRYIQRDITVVPSTTGSVPDGFQQVGLTCAPATIRISGPEDEVKAVQRIETELLDLNFDRSFSKKLKLKKLDMPNLVCSTVEVIAKVVIAPVPFESKRFEKVPVRYLYPASSAERRGSQKELDIISPVSDVTVVITAPKAVMDEIEHEKLFVVADLSSDTFAGKAAKVTVPLYCPVGLRNFSHGRVRELDIRPASVEVTLQFSEVKNNRK